MCCCHQKIVSTNIICNRPCLIFSRYLAHGDPLKHAEAKNSKVSQVLPDVKSTCHSAARLNIIDILDNAICWWGFWQLWQTDDISDFIGVYERFVERSSEHFEEDLLILDWSFLNIILMGIYFLSFRGCSPNQNVWKFCQSFLFRNIGK